MAGVMVKRNVILRSVVTDKLKQDLQDELQHAVDEIDQRVRQIDFRTQPYITDLQRTNIQQAMAVRKQVETEKERQQQLRSGLQERQEQLKTLVNDDEVIRGALDSYIEIKEGDNLADVLGGVEIVTKDDLVIAIRERSMIDLQREAAPAIITDLSAGLDSNAPGQL